MIRLIHGDASAYTGPADFVFTHPYAMIPAHLQRLPMLVNLALPRGHEAERIADAERWCGSRLTPLSDWAKDGWNTVFCANLPARTVGLTDLRAVEEGWFPEELPRRLFALYADVIPPGAVVWDGFMGRGTVGKVALELGYGFVGIDNRADRVAHAREYLGMDTVTLVKETTFGTEPATAFARLRHAEGVAAGVIATMATPVLSGSFECECGGTVSVAVEVGKTAHGVPCDSCDRTYTVESYGPPADP